jgi:hypothetical protein
VGAAIIGIVRFNEPRDWPRVACIAMIIVGIVGLKVLHRDARRAARRRRKSLRRHRHDHPVPVRGPCRGCDRLLQAAPSDFEEEHRMAMPGGKIGHASLVLRDAKVFLSDESPMSGVKSPNQLGGATTVGVHLDSPGR